MPQITIKTKHVKKLKELGVYDKWYNNLVTQWDDWSKEYPFLTDELKKSDSFDRFIQYSFRWSDTPEKRQFWEEISLK